MKHRGFIRLLGGGYIMAARGARSSR